jgi:hypothetical protein
MVCQVDNLSFLKYIISLPFYCKHFIIIYTIVNNIRAYAVKKNHGGAPVLGSMEFIALNKIGLIFNIVGTLMIALSFGKNLEDAYQTNNKGQKVYLASFLRPKIFWFGILFLLLGFIIQLIA